MIIDLDTDSAITVLDQLVTQIAGAIRVGTLDPGDRLPTVRQLAADLGLAPGTVAKAYGELEAAGLVAGHGRRGTVVLGDAATITPPAVSETVCRLVELARSANMSLDELTTLIRAAN